MVYLQALEQIQLNWERGTQIRTVQTHVRLEVVMATVQINDLTPGNDKGKIRIGITHSLLRKLSKGDWEKYGKVSRYMM